LKEQFPEFCFEDKTGLEGEALSAYQSECEAKDRLVTVERKFDLVNGLSKELEVIGTYQLGQNLNGEATTQGFITVLELMEASLAI
jgi:hypothetical protein